MPKTVAEQIAGMKYPMEAVGNVTVGDAQYAAGAIFDAKDIGTVNFLKSRKAALSLSGTTQPVAAAAVPTEAVQASAEQASNAGIDATPETAPVAEKVQDDRQPQSPGKSGVRR